MMGLGQGNRAAPPSWIQLSAVMVNVFKQLKLGAIISDPRSDTLIHSMGALYVDDGELWKQTRIEIEQWSAFSTQPEEH